MEKHKLMSFISKYSLGGNVDSAEWKITSEGMSTRFITDDQNAIGDVFVNFQNPNINGDIIFGIANTPLLIKMASVLGDEINVDLLTRNGVAPESLQISDGDSVVTYMIADPSIIKKAPAAKNFPDPTYEFPLTKEGIIDKFLKAKSAFTEESKFTISQKKTNLNIVVGTSLNKVSISIKDEVIGNPTRDISFDAKYFKEMLNANKDFVSAKFSVYERGIGRVDFQHEDATASYYLMEM
jgi:hypothetical protein